MIECECGNILNDYEAVCCECGLVHKDRPIVTNMIPLLYRSMKSGDMALSEHDIWEYPLRPQIRKRGIDFVPKYQKIYEDYVYLKAYESINKLCASLRLSPNVRFEALNLFKGIRKLDPEFFRINKLAPTYLACIKIACKINDFPISNYELAKTIDYKTRDSSTKNRSYMEKKFNRSYRAILKLYGLQLKNPEHPNFINYACNILNTSYIFIVKIHKEYTRLRRFFMPHFKIEGYILALIYIYGKEDYGLILKTFEKKFHISSLTISSRRKELLKYIEVK
jgi:hypothetical protein